MRTYIIGAGFSHAVANAPLMWQLWDYIKVAYEKEKCREDLLIVLSYLKN